MKSPLRNPIRPRAFTRPTTPPAPDFRLEFIANKENEGVWMLACPQLKCCFPTKDLIGTIKSLVENEIECLWEGGV